MMKDRATRSVVVATISEVKEVLHHPFCYENRVKEYVRGIITETVLLSKQGTKCTEFLYSEHY